MIIREPIRPDPDGKVCAFGKGPGPCDCCDNGPAPIPAELLADPILLARMARLIGQRALRAAELAEDAARTGAAGAADILAESNRLRAGWNAAYAAFRAAIGETDEYGRPMPAGKDDR
jgi:hypothetical protein